MTALALKLRQARPFQWPRDPVFRAIGGGTLWGLILSGGLLTLSYQSCGGICFADAFVTTLVSVFAGIATVGPTTILGAKH
jgi:hypothetical protein